MKKILLSAVVFAISTFCTFAGIKRIVIDKVAEPDKTEKISENPNMEFIGFKGYDADGSLKMMKKESNFDKFGSSLQFAGIAIDSAYTYFGIYSLQELEVYKSSKRYVTFVEVADFKVSHEKAPYGSDCGTCCNGTPSEAQQKTITKFNIVCNIYVYDTQTRSIKFKKDFSVNKEDVWDGWIILDDKADVDWAQIMKYYGIITVNTLLDEYRNVYTHVVQ